MRSHRKHTAYKESLVALKMASVLGYRRLSTERVHIINKLYIKKAFKFFLSFLICLSCRWLEIDLAAQLLYNRRSLKRGPFRPATDHQVNAS